MHLVVVQCFSCFEIVTINPHQVIRLFKPNILFKSFEMKDSVDRVLVYVTLYIVGEKKGNLPFLGTLGVGLTKIDFFGLWPPPPRLGICCHQFFVNMCL